MKHTITKKGELVLQKDGEIVVIFEKINGIWKGTSGSFENLSFDELKTIELTVELYNTDIIEEHSKFIKYVSTFFMEYEGLYHHRFESKEPMSLGELFIEFHNK